MSDSTRVTLTMVSALKPCKKCDACRQLIGRLQERFPGRVEYHEVRADDPEAAGYGVVMPPMLVVDDFIVSSGNVPVERGLVQLVAEMLGVDASS